MNFPPEINSIFSQPCIFQFSASGSPSIKCHHWKVEIRDLRFWTSEAQRCSPLGYHTVHPRTYSHCCLQCTATNKSSCCFLSSLNLHRGCYKPCLLPAWKVSNSRCNTGFFAAWGNSLHLIVFLTSDRELQQEPVFECLTGRQLAYYHN